MSRRRTGAIAAALATLTTIAALAAASASAAPAGTIVIGWAFDGNGAMAPFDGPALAAAQIRVKQVNARGGVNGKRLRIATCNTQGNKPAIARACAAKLLSQGANVIFTTCDVDFATPVVQEAINRGVLAVAPCIGTDQMGPKRFGAKGRLAFSFGNVAQDEGSAMAQFAWSKGWRTASLATDTVIVYFKDVVKAFKARFTQLGGKIVAEESYQSLGSTNITNAVTRLNGQKADVIVTSTAGAFGALPQMIAGLRTLGNQTPVLNSWAGDGTYWVTKEPQVTNYYFVTYASIFGDDPAPGVNALAKALKAGTGGFVTGSAAIDGVVTAIKRSKGSTTGRGARGHDGEVQEGADALGPRELLADPALRVRAAVPRDPDPEQQGQADRNGRRQGRPDDLSTTVSTGADEQSEDGRPGGALRAADLERSFDGVHAVRGVSLTLHRHEVVGLIGPNGAGKSTLVNLLTGFDLPTSGHVELDGRDITRWSASRRGRHGLARTFQHSRPFRSLSVRENVEVSALGAGASPAGARRTAEELLGLLGLEGSAEAAAGALAHGDERRLGVARALATRPSFVLLDEPAAGLPEAEVPEFAAVVRSVRDAHGAGVLLIDHNMALIMDVCDRIQVLDQGRTLAEGTPGEVRANLDVAAAYLGESAVHEGPS